MSQATELIATQMAAGSNIGKIWGTLVYNVKDTAYGAIGDGSTDDTTALTNAVSAASVNGGMVVLPPGTYKTGSFTVPSNVTLWFINGAKLSVNSGATVTINGPIEAELHQIFSGLGTVTGFTKIPQVFPQWWGALADAVNDDTLPITKAFATNRPTRFAPGTYRVTSQIVVTANNFVACGERKEKSIIFFDGCDGFSITGDYVDVRELTFSTNSTTKIGLSHNGKYHNITRLLFNGMTLAAYWAKGIQSQNVWSSDYTYIEFIGGTEWTHQRGIAIDAQYSVNNSINNCKFVALEYGVYIDDQYSGGGTTGFQSEGWIITNNIFIVSNYGVRAKVGQWTDISHNIFDKMFLFGIYAQFYAAGAISFNWFAPADTTNIPASVAVQVQRGDRITVSDNHTSAPNGIPAALPNYGFIINGSYNIVRNNHFLNQQIGIANNGQHNILNGNNFNLCTTYSIAVQSDYNIITGNQFNAAPLFINATYTHNVNANNIA